ncbi:hypothetical protein [Rubinisphaera margarita]|uniref:hypothetical protein n=1 Tax=Rubinisphaera margarita TaxID=2909586 RepID=UPI001EE92A77|nr:hypothetical protein [Rubinisphaera margarita]MCG6157819.1 hypothetical protein [Rubinisphaera margarita]
MHAQVDGSWSALIAVLLGCGFIIWLIRTAMSRRPDGSRSVSSLIAITILPLLLIAVMLGAPAVTYLQQNQSPNVSQVARTATPKSMKNQFQSNMVTEETLADLRQERAALEEQIRDSDSEDREQFEEQLRELDEHLAELEHSLESYPRWLREDDPFSHDRENGVNENPLQVQYDSQDVISSERYTTVEESREDALRRLRLAVAVRIRRDFAGFDLTDRHVYSLEQLESFVLDEHVETFNLRLKTQEIEAAMFRTHLLVDFSPEQFAQLLPEIRDETVDTRIRMAGIALLAVTCVSGLIGFGTRRWTRGTHTA